MAATPQDLVQLLLNRIPPLHLYMYQWPPHHRIQCSPQDLVQLTEQSPPICLNLSLNLNLNLNLNINLNLNLNLGLNLNLNLNLGH